MSILSAQRKGEFFLFKGVIQYRDQVPGSYPDVGQVHI